MRIDPHGRTIATPQELIDLLYRGQDITPDLLCESCQEIDQYNKLCQINDKSEFFITVEDKKTISAQIDHAERQTRWFIPEHYINMDIWSVLADRCSSVDQLDRLLIEQAEYQKRDLENVLRLMIYLVDDFRSRNILWGVGRGSSVASFVLYLIGITRINPLDYDLDIGEFLKD